MEFGLKFFESDLLRFVEVMKEAVEGKFRKQGPPDAFGVVNRIEYFPGTDKDTLTRVV